MATPAITWSYYTGSEWTAISGYVLTKYGCSGFWGMGSNKHTDRIARTGEMRVVLNNTSGCFDPEDTDALTGWGINTKIKLEVTFDGTTYRRFYGTVQDIKFSDPNTKEHTATVLITDWMNYAYKFPLTASSVEAYKLGGYAVDSIVDDVSQTPLATNYSAGDYVYDATYDSTTVKTKAATEINKIVMSELGYFYNKHDKINGETLVFEAAGDRGADRAISKIPKLVADCGYILQAGSAVDKVLDTAGNNIVAAEVQDAHMNGIANGYKRSYGDNILNSVKITAYPKRVDTTEQTLYKLGTVMVLSSGEVKTINARYQNLTTKEYCNALTSQMIAPVATTDYTMNSNSGGTGTDLTSSLSVTAVYRAAEVELTLTNSGSVSGFITLLKCRGYGVYQDSSINTKVEDTTSQATYSMSELNIDQQYQRDTVRGEAEAYKILDIERNPRTRLDEAAFIANKSDFAMLAFLAIDIGDMVKITESSLNLADYYYVQGIRFSIGAGNVITYSWTLKEPINMSYSDIMVEFTNISNQYINFGVSPAQNLTQKTVMARIDLTSFGDTSVGQGIISKGGFGIYIATTSERIIVIQGFSGSVPYWATNNNTMTTGVHQIAVTYDRGSTANDPIVYIDGAASVVTESATAPIGAVLSDLTHNLELGRCYITTKFSKSPDGKLYDVRVFDRLLSAGEIASEYATPGTVTNGLVFLSPSVSTNRLAEYEDLTLSSENRIYDEVGDYVGKPTGSPIARLIP